MSILKIEVIKCLQYYWDDKAIIEHKRNFLKEYFCVPINKNQY